MYQLDPSLPTASKVNPEIANEQARDNFVGPASAALYSITQAASAYPGDPNAGGVDAASGLSWNEMTQTQKLQYIYWGTGMPVFGSQPLTTQLANQLKANAGPVAPWNYSYQQAGVVPGNPGVLPIATVVQLANGTAVAQTGQLLPSA